MSCIDNETINKLVFNLEKPARYTGGELNQVKKSNSLVKMAISFPDIYEIGMSNNGIRILYDIANNLEFVSCERVFAVAPDFEKKIKSTGIPLYTLENKLPINELDIIGFNIAHELLYTNVLQILDLGRIPIISKERKQNDPLILAGGEAVSNPLPFRDFIDAFFVGDGEDGIIDILTVIKNSKHNSFDREETLGQLSKIDGIYIPTEKKRNTCRRHVRAASFHNPIKPLIPNIKITQERFVVEVTRGCGNLCNFCHAGFYDLPLRIIKPDRIRDQVFELIKEPYYDELSISSLSVSDYSYLIQLLNMIMPALMEKGISISLPSLRVDKNTMPVVSELAELRKSSLTFAVESGCEEIRNLANKRLNTDEIIEIADIVFSGPWKLLKLYFMIGLPGCEEYDEAEAIINLLKGIAGGRKRNINITVSPFVPKPHTPFQWEKQMGFEYINETISRIKRGVPRQVSVKAHDVNASLLEGIISRGDERLNTVIYSSYMDGCRFDSWKEYFNFNVWKKNLDDLITDWNRYLDAREPDQSLPWNFISAGHDSLIKSRYRNKNILSKKPLLSRINNDELNASAISESMILFKRKYEVKRKLRIRLSKTGNSRYIPHLDFMAIIIRSLRLAGVPVSFTQGFNKHEKISMGYPLPIGIESVCELCDIELFDEVDLKLLPDKINAKLPENIAVINAEYKDGKESLMSVTCAALYRIEINDHELLSAIFRNLDKQIQFTKETKNGNKKIINFENAIIDSSADKNKIHLKTIMGNENFIRIDKIALTLAEAGYDEFYRFRITKLEEYRKNSLGLYELL